jgi:type IV pilus assembly protein PilY1
LATAGERANLPPQQFQKVLVAVANTPAIADPCASGGQSKIFALDPVTGAAPSFPVFDTNKVVGFDDGDAGLNVLINKSSMLTQPVFQIPPETGSTTTSGSGSGGVGSTVGDPGPTLRVEDPFYRGQVTGTPGGVNLTDPEGPCTSLLSAPQSNTNMLQLLLNGCLKTPRVSWRQLK